MVSTDSYVFRNGLVVDGTGSEPFVGDVEIVNGRIGGVGRVGRAQNATEFDATGLVVAPGFIDIHTHYDAQVLWDDLLESSTQYGFTTLVLGNCGIGIAPYDDNREYLISLLSNVEGMPPDSLRHGLSWNWTTFGDYLNAIDRPMGANIIPLVGHSALRHAVMGDAAIERAARQDELNRLQVAFREALSNGAWGFSTSKARTHNDSSGRPAASRLAEWEEFEALADVLGEYPFGIIGINPESKLVGMSEHDTSLLTMLSVRGGASVNWNPLVHVSDLPELYKTNLRTSEVAKKSGGRVFGVFNPTSFGGSRVDLRSCFLFAPLPHWKPIAPLSIADKMVAFSDPTLRKDLEDDILYDKSFGFLTVSLRSMWDVLRVTETFSSEAAQYRGRIVGDVARETGRSPLNVMLDIALLDGLQTVFMQEDVPDVDDMSLAAFNDMARSDHVVYGGTDAGAHVDMIANESMPARVLRYRVNEQQSLSLAEAVHGFTAKNADALGIPGRGRLQPGNAGDVVVFDQATIGAGPAFVRNDLPGGGERMMTRASGVVYTMVNGTILYEDGHPSAARPGRLLRSGA